MTKKQKGGDKDSVDYNTALSALGFIPGVGKGVKAGKKAKKVKKSKKSKKQAGGTFNTGQGSFIEPGMEQI